MTHQHIVVQSEHLAEPARRWLEQQCTLIRCDHDDPGFHAALEHAHALVVRTYTPVNAELLSHAANLRVVGRAGVGLDNIDLETCAARNITVVNTPDANTQAVLEYVLTLLTNTLRPMVRLTTPVDNAEWARLRAETVGQRQLADLTLGILGLGRIGKRLARTAAALGMTVQYHDLLDIPIDQRYDAHPVDAPTLFATSDVLSIHIDGRPANRAIVDAKLLDTIKPDTVFINTSRGFVVDHHALAAALTTRPAAVALLDVHDPEPIAADNPLLTLANAHLYPHLASRTQTAMDAMSWVVRDVIDALNGPTS